VFKVITVNNVQVIKPPMRSKLSPYKLLLSLKTFLIYMSCSGDI